MTESTTLAHASIDTDASVVPCRECGCPMHATDRCVEGRVRFTWFSCSRAGCRETLLRREGAQGSGAVASSV